MNLCSESSRHKLGCELCQVLTYIAQCYYLHFRKSNMR